MEKIALCVGINDYPGTDSDLSGCVNDANNWMIELQRRKFKVEKLLNNQANKNNFISHVESLLELADRDDLAVITYSGHGSWVPDSNGDEADGRDECICLYDDIIIDDDLYNVFSRKKRGTKLIFICDSCHSGTVMRDKTDRKIRFLNPEKLFKGQLLKTAKRIEKNKKNIRTPNCLLISGCKDDQYSFDAVINGKACGAFSYYALKTLKNINTDATYKDWYRRIKHQISLSEYKDQEPQLRGTPRMKGWKVFQ